MEKQKLLLEALREDLKKVSMPYEAHVQVESIMRHYETRFQSGPSPNGAGAPKPEKVKSNG